jgi:Natural resistance-associated macrophage protein
MHWRIQPWVRRLITRTLAILLAVFIIGLRGDSSVTDLLTLSQVVLALQLPFAMFPLVHFTSCHRRMGNWKNAWFLLIAGTTKDHRNGTTMYDTIVVTLGGKRKVLSRIRCCRYEPASSA